MFAVAGTKSNPEPRRWDLFTFASDSAPDGGERYRVEGVKAGAGAAGTVQEGWWCRRAQASALASVEMGEAVVFGTVDAALSTSQASAQGLERAWRSSPWRVALLLSWAHHPDGDQGLLGPAAEMALRLARAPRLAERVLRRVYRPVVRPDDRRDFLAYLEMQPEDVAPLRELLDSPGRSPAGQLQIWLSKQLHRGV